MYNFEEIVGKTIIDMHATTVKTELYRKAGEQIDEHTFYVDKRLTIALSLFPASRIIS